MYGLHGAVYTPNAERGYEVVWRMRSGSVTVNGMIVDPKMPFGGFKQSGWGRRAASKGSSGTSSRRPSTSCNAAGLSGVGGRVPL